ncbi:hypothetical protein ACGFX8_32970 [Streptomyces sp. NPDC048362]|uniref:hypothetical protein n=1 Tax=Streptomyces sp. NPDC048362 TaxID=3365539 RepID=UPI00371CA7C7
MTVVDFPSGIRSGQDLSDAQELPAAAGAADFPDGHDHHDGHSVFAVGEHNSQPTIELASTTDLASAGSDFPDGHSRFGAQCISAVGEHNPPAPARPAVPSKDDSPVLASNPWDDSNAPLLALLADALDDIENMRNATANRLRQLTRAEADKDGGTRGFGLTLDHPQVAAVAAMLSAIKHDDNILKDLGYPTAAIRPRDENGKLLSRACTCLECTAIRNLQKELRNHPLGPWVKNTKGVGEKQAARLLGTIGDPYWNTLHERPRLVSELWQYAGHGDPARSKRRRGQLVEHSPDAKKRTWLISSKCVTFIDKSTCNDGTHADRCKCSPYRLVYDAQRRHRRTSPQHRLRALRPVRPPRRPRYPLVRRTPPRRRPASHWQGNPQRPLARVQAHPRGSPGMNDPTAYDRGGLLCPGITLATNTTGQPEPVIAGTEHEEDEA